MHYIFTSQSHVDDSLLKGKMGYELRLVTRPYSHHIIYFCFYSTNFQLSIILMSIWLMKIIVLSCTESYQIFVAFRDNSHFIISSHSSGSDSGSLKYLHPYTAGIWSSIGSFSRNRASILVSRLTASLTSSHPGCIQRAVLPAESPRRKLYCSL